MNLIGILNNGEIKRLPLSRSIQDDLKSYYNDIKNSFLNKTRVEFQGTYKCEEEEIYELKGFDWRNKIKYNSLSDFDFNSILTISTINVNEIYNIKILIAMTESYLIFQSIDSRKFIKPNSFLFYSDNTFNYEDKKGIKLDNKVDALLEIESNTVLFNSFHNASKIFDLFEIFREATNEELEEFQKHELFSDGLTLDKINNRLRKKIFLIQKNGILNKIKQNYNIVKNYANEVGLSTYFNDNNNNKIVIPSDLSELTKLINFLNEDLYKSPISGVIYESNSKKLVGKKDFNDSPESQ